jgi:hypothetical protein
MVHQISDALHTAMVTANRSPEVGVTSFIV